MHVRQQKCRRILGRVSTRQRRLIPVRKQHTDAFEEKMTPCNILISHTALLSLSKPVGTQNFALFQTCKRQLKMWTAVQLESF